MLEQAHLHNIKEDWSIVLETAIKAEKLFRLPQTAMPFNPSGAAIMTFFSSTFLPVDHPVQHDPSIIDISLDHNSQHKAYNEKEILNMPPSSSSPTHRNNLRPVAVNVPRPVNPPNPIQQQPEPVVQQPRTRDPSPAPDEQRVEEPRGADIERYFSTVVDEIESPYRRSNRLASMPRLDYNETSMARAGAARAASSDQTPTTSRTSGSIKSN
jgi:hypothetical protein